MGALSALCLRAANPLILLATALRPAAMVGLVSTLLAASLTALAARAAEPAAAEGAAYLLDLQGTLGPGAAESVAIPTALPVTQCYRATVESAAADVVLRLVGQHSFPTADRPLSQWPRALLREADLTTLPGAPEQLTFAAAAKGTYLQVSWRLGSAPVARWRLRLQRCPATAVARSVQAQRLVRTVQSALQAPQGLQGTAALRRLASAARWPTHSVALAQAFDALGAHGDAGALWATLTNRFEQAHFAAASSLQQRRQMGAARIELCALFRKLTGVDCDAAPSLQQHPALLLRLANRLALLGLDRAEFAEAQRWFLLADDVAAEGSWPEQEARLLNNRAGLAAQQGDSEQAALFFSEALALAELMGDQAGVAAVASNLAVLDDRAGRSDLARVGFERALQIHRTLGDPLAEGIVLCRLGQVSATFGARAEADEQLQEGERLLLATGNQGAAARCALNRALAVPEAEFTLARQSFARARRLALAGQDPVTAARALIGQYGVASPQRADELRRTADAELSAGGFTALSAELAEVVVRRLERAGHSARAGQGWLALSEEAPPGSPAQVGHLLEALRIAVQRTATAVGGDRKALLASAQAVLVRCQRALGYSPQDSPRRSLRRLERRLLVLESAVLRLRAEQAAGTERARLERAALAVLVRAERRTAARIFVEQRAAAQRSALAELVDARQRSDDRQQRLRLTSEIRAQRLRSDPEVFNRSVADKGQTLPLPALPAGEAWLHLHHGPDGVFAWLWSDETLRLIRYENAQALPEALEAAAVAVRRQQPPGGDLLVLGERLLIPLWQHLEGVRRLRLSGDRALRALPWASLRFPIAPASPAEHLTQLLELYTALHWDQPPAAAPTKPAEALLVGVSAGSGALAPLPYVDQELRALETTLRQQGITRRTTLRETAATRDAVLHALTQVSGGLVHIAAHGQSSPYGASLSGLYLAPAGAVDRKQSGFVGYGDLMGVRTDADLVVLSACETAVSPGAAGTMNATLAAAFGHAGARWVLASRWPVDDQATARLMALFYRHWLAGERDRKDPVTALAAAQRALRATVDFRHPVFWAGFELLQVR